MKRLIPYVVATALMFSSISVVLAVEKQKKEQPAPKTEAVKPAEPPKDAKPADPRDKKQVQPTPPKKYDDFIDRNGNGVDDRKENLKKKDA